METFQHTCWILPLVSHDGPTRIIRGPNPHNWSQDLPFSPQNLNRPICYNSSSKRGRLHVLFYSGRSDWVTTFEKKKAANFKDPQNKWIMKRCTRRSLILRTWFERNKEAEANAWRQPTLQCRPLKAGLWSSAARYDISDKRPTQGVDILFVILCKFKNSFYTHLVLLYYIRGFCVPGAWSMDVSVFKLHHTPRFVHW